MIPVLCWPGWDSPGTSGDDVAFGSAVVGSSVLELLLGTPEILVLQSINIWIPKTNSSNPRVERVDIEN